MTPSALQDFSDRSSLDRAMPLTEADWRSLYERAEDRGETLSQQTSEGEAFRLPQHLGDAGERTVILRDGLSIAIRQGRLNETMRYWSVHDADFPLVAKFYLAGRSRIQTPDAKEIQDEYIETRGCHYLYHLPHLTEIEEWPSHEALQVVYVTVDLNYFERFATDTATALPPLLQPLIRGETPHRFHQPLGGMSPEINQVLQQIVHCPYQGMMQQFYLESKALELLTLQFATLGDQPLQRGEISLRSYDVDRLHQAREIIQRRAEQPPSLTELARQVGLNDRKLKQGFRQLFGTTVFGYLQTYRLEQARLLLQDIDCTIAQVALKVGYTNPEAFSAAFRRKFAISPKAYQLAQRR
ncbi:MAG: AraC family transcriptional regulator [Cyanobacteria bacterium P01_H01_bin.130]